MHSPTWLTNFPRLIAGVSTREGGVSPYPADALNLGLYTDDKQENVLENRRRFAKQLGIEPDQFAGGHQVHGKEVKRVTEAGEYEGYDAFITNRPGIILTVTAADCTPVLIFDPINHACGAAHAGWRGTVAGVVSDTLYSMVSEFGTDPGQCYAYIAPCISLGYFEVSADVAQQFANQFVKKGEAPGKYFVDLKRANADQLIKAGVPAHQIELSELCTVANSDQFFSYRKEGGQTGRMLGVIGRRG